MNKFSQLILIGLFFGNGVFASEIDFSKCEKFFAVRTMAPVVPFDFKGNGKMEIGHLRQGKISYKHDPNKRQDIFNEQRRVVTLKFTEDLENGKITADSWLNAKKESQYWRAFDVKTVVQRDGKGNVLEIYKDFPQEHIDHEIALRRDFYNRRISANERRWQKKRGIGHNPEKYSVSRSTIRFEIINNQCVPMEAKDTFLLGSSKKKAKSFDITLFNTRLCKDILDFFDKYPKTKSCFDSGLNRKMGTIFEKYIGSDEANRVDEMKKGTRGGPSFWSPGIHTIYAERGHLGLDTYVSSQIKRQHSNESSIFSAHEILRHCDRFGLSSIIRDKDIWKTNESKGGPEPEKKNKSISR